jgi:hypothetical protein
MLNRLRNKVRLGSLLGAVLLTPLVVSISTPAVLVGAGVAYFAVIATIPKRITERQIRRYVVPALGVAAIVSGTLIYALLPVSYVFPAAYATIGLAIIAYGRHISRASET